MKLYFAPRTAAIRPRWLLEEIGAPYELVKLDLSKHENVAPAYLAVHPLGQVPALVDGDVMLFETLAICLHLADRFPEKQLAPAVGSRERAHYYQWMVFAEASLAPLVMKHYERAQLPEDTSKLNDVLDVIDTALDGREVLVGDRFTAADLAMASILHLANTLELLSQHPRLVEYVYRHAQRPALRRAIG